MRNPRRQRPSVAEATAAAWLAQRDDGLTPDEAAEFACWRAADVRHEAAVQRLERSWNLLQQLREFRPEARMHPDADLLRRTALPRRTRLRAVAVTAAMAASLALATAWWLGSPAPDRGDTRATYATALHGLGRVSLDDGSIVELNSTSEVHVRFTAAERRVLLVRGEAYFTVTRNKSRPFFVDAGAVTVRAVGTAFNVRLSAAEIEVLVTEGTVEIGEAGPVEADPRSGADERARSPKQPRRTTLAPAFVTANERIIIPAMPSSSTTVAPRQQEVERLDPTAVSERLAWQGRRLVFVDTPLSEAVAEFNRHNRVQIVLADAELEELPIGGSFQSENVDAFVRLLSSASEIAVERPAADRIVVRKAK